jgi:hypothetical protein
MGPHGRQRSREGSRPLEPPRAPLGVVKVKLPLGPRFAGAPQADRGHRSRRKTTRPKNRRHSRALISCFQRLAAPCQARFFLFNFQCVKPSTVGFFGPYRNAVATFVLRASPPPVWSGPAGIRERISGDRQSGREHLDPKRRQLEARSTSTPAVSFAQRADIPRRLGGRVKSNLATV